MQKNIVPQLQMDCVEGSVLQGGWHMSFQPHPYTVKDLCANQLGASIHSNLLGPSSGMGHCTLFESFLRI